MRFGSCQLRIKPLPASVPCYFILEPLLGLEGIKHLIIAMELWKSLAPLEYVSMGNLSLMTTKESHGPSRTPFQHLSKVGSGGFRYQSLTTKN